MPHPPLFQPGFHQIQLADLGQHFVTPFPQSATRVVLAQSLATWVGHVAATGVSGQVWLDGSFSTHKTDPQDVDLVLVFEASSVQSMAPGQQTILQALLNQQSTRALYSCDVYCVASNDIAMVSYWRGWFGFSRSQVPKGIPFLQL
ncbi:DUF6932 family protein [Ralstonia solanacearum]|uniref:DUF6932 family protein n=1 Tax=Ralstonia solanacearum TaxID=305 RepID=UPI003AF327B0